MEAIGGWWRKPRRVWSSKSSGQSRTSSDACSGREKGSSRRTCAVDPSGRSADKPQEDRQECNDSALSLRLSVLRDLTGLDLGWTGTEVWARLGVGYQ